jgi:hypothetical protein
MKSRNIMFELLDSLFNVQLDQLLILNLGPFFQAIMATDSNSVYGLVTQLCEKIMKEHISSHSLEHRSSNKILKGLRALSYGILLNKSHTSCK